jgi:hypothetical protein
MMSLYLSKPEKAEYEQRRRKVVMQESRDYRLMSRWLLKVYPDVLTEYCAYKTRLQKANPVRKDLTTAPQFLRFMLMEDGT